jgi:hypothetical protein
VLLSPRSADHGGTAIDISEDRIREALETGPDWHSSGAVSWSLGAGATGTFGTDPAPDVAAALTALVAAGDVVHGTACPVCGRPGDLFALASRVPADTGRAAPISEVEIDEAMEPLVTEGVIEVAELIEVDERACCVRTGRAWRRTPRPS